MPRLRCRLDTLDHVLELRTRLTSQLVKVGHPTRKLGKTRRLRIFASRPLRRDPLKHRVRLNLPRTTRNRGKGKGRNLPSSHLPGLRYLQRYQRPYQRTVRLIPPLLDQTLFERCPNVLRPGVHGRGRGPRWRMTHDSCTSEPACGPPNQAPSPDLTGLVTTPSINQPPPPTPSTYESPRQS